MHIQVLKFYFNYRFSLQLILVNTMNNRMTITRKQKWEGKQLYGRFKRLMNNISHDITWTWLGKGNFKRETESLLIAEQDSALRINNIKARIDKTQQNSKCRLCGDRDETINHIISECSKLAQREYKARHDWVGKVIHWCYIIAEGFRFMPLTLVWLRTFRLSTWVS